VSTPLLELRELHKHYPARTSAWLAPAPQPLRAVDGVSFAIERGEAFGLVGGSGCGKSTVARLATGLLEPSAGSIRFDGVELAGRPPRAWRAVRPRLQIVFQDPHAALDPRQRVHSILTEPLRIHGVGKPRERRARALELLEAVGLGERHLEAYPHEFSGGQRQRICIARALALRPELIVLDEPVSALDVSVQAQIVNLLADLQRELGLGYLFIAHDLAVVRRLCTRVAVMQAGRIVECGPREQVFEQPRHACTRELLGAVLEARPS